LSTRKLSQAGAFFLLALPAFAQDTAAPPSPPREITSENSPTAFKLNVNLVVVRVVVRAANGKPVRNLEKDDFLLFDNGKRQPISSFSVDTPSSHISRQSGDSAPTANASVPIDAPVNSVQLPRRFVALYFDDLNISDSDLTLSRQAGMKLLSAMPTDDRLAVFTASGHTVQEFTNDKQELSAALQRLAPHPLGGPGMTADCPTMTYYESYAIIELHDPNAVQLASADARNCMGALNGSGGAMGAANSNSALQQMVYSAAQRAEAEGLSQVQLALRNLQSVVRRMSVLPGQRVIAMMSPGFFAMAAMQELSEAVEHATKSNIVINTIDARGLYGSKLFDAQQTQHANVSALHSAEFVQFEESIQGDVLASIADGTGGSYLHNRNDIDNSLLEAAAEPEISYVLGFSPQDMKSDGKYHNLKVTLSTKHKDATLQARHGYFAPKKSTDPEQLANQEIDEAITSQEEMRELPVNCETQIFKGEKGTRLSVVARVDTKNLKFRKIDDRNDDHLRVVMALFDNNGNFLAGTERTINLQLKDTSLALINKTGIRVKLDFDVLPGNLLVRVVVRDSEGSQLGATSQSVSIPN
jgi:VWFA-related protein